MRLASYLMYPKVFSDFVKTQDKYGPTEVLPTPVYFYGLEEGEEVFVDIEKGKTLVLNYLGRAETNEKGEVRVFFDLNGQPRTITVPDRLKVGEIKVRAKAALGDAKQVGAPMPGVISALGVKVGDKVIAGDVLLLDRSHEDGNRHPRRSRWRRRRSARSSPATRSTPRICWSGSSSRQHLAASRRSTRACPGSCRQRVGSGLPV